MGIILAMNHTKLDVSQHEIIHRDGMVMMLKKDIAKDVLGYIILKRK